MMRRLSWLLFDLAVIAALALAWARLPAERIYRQPRTIDDEAHLWPDDYDAMGFPP